MIPGSCGFDTSRNRGENAWLFGSRARPVFTTGASLIASGRVPTLTSQCNGGGSFEGMFCSHQRK
jgi:hypothetical protein